MESYDRTNKIIEEMKYIDSTDVIYQIGCVNALSNIKYLMEKEFPTNEIIKYIETSINRFSDDLRLLYMELLVEYRKGNK